MTNVLISAAGLCGATIIGAILGFFVKELPHKWNDAVLGYCAGIMLAASTLGLIVPAFEQTSLWWLVVIGVMAGALFLKAMGMSFGNHLIARYIEHGATGKAQHHGEEGGRG
jgi:zinc transporter, ZIP family